MGRPHTDPTGFAREPSRIPVQRGRLSTHDDELLLNLAHAFDSQYTTHICRHYDELSHPPPPPIARAMTDSSISSKATT